MNNTIFAFIILHMAVGGCYSCPSIPLSCVLMVPFSLFPFRSSVLGPCDGQVQVLHGQKRDTDAWQCDGSDICVTD